MIIYLKNNLDNYASVTMFKKRIEIWEQTKKLSKKYKDPETYKFIFSESNIIKQNYSKTHIDIVNEDSIILGKKLKDHGFNPLVLIFADHRFAGGDVGNGSGAQEESLFRRTNLCNGLLQNKFYPIFSGESIILKNVTVFRDIEKNNYEFITPYVMDFIACPGIQNPKIENGIFNEHDEFILRTKIKCIFQAAQNNNNDSLVLGPIGCGSWRCPPKEVARIFKEEISKYNGSFKIILFACLEVDQKDYIVVNRHHESNYHIFTDCFKVI